MKGREASTVWGCSCYERTAGMWKDEGRWPGQPRSGQVTHTLLSCGGPGNFLGWELSCHLPSGCSLPQLPHPSVLRIPGSALGPRVLWMGVGPNIGSLGALTKQQRAHRMSREGSVGAKQAHEGGRTITL